MGLSWEESIVYLWKMQNTLEFLPIENYNCIRKNDYPKSEEDGKSYFRDKFGLIA